MSKFACHTAHAIEDFSVQDDRTADAGAERDHRHVVGIASRTQPFFPQSCEIRVVVEEDARAQAPLDFIAHGIVGPAGKVGGLAHHSGFPVDDTGDSDARPDKLAAGAILLGKTANRVTHLADHVVTAEGNLHTQRDFLQ